ncbi:MAG: GNAT family N-acetyltransferase [Firmicutes bacterium]|jgi:GNAT superfamily N-acetyltransferase|nr:GNAT family N-acetyltransferase [Bacillota bacterium]
MAELEFHPVTSERWGDLETLFGPNGACAGCWCMWWRVTRSEWERRRGEGNRSALKRIVDSGEVPGILAYSEDRPVGWCSVGPREAFPVLQRSRVLKPLDGEPVWSIVCFFVAKGSRRKGMTVELIDAAVDYARSRGARIVEGYPVVPAGMNMTWAYTGVESAFLKAGFQVVARPSARRLIVRRHTG